MMSEDDNLQEKKLRGSGGFVLAYVKDEEQKKGNLGGPELFLAGIGRLPSERFVKYHCNKCDKDFEGSPVIRYDNPNEDLGEDVILVEKGEYKCHACNTIIAQYRKFDSASKPSQNESNSQIEEPQSVASLESDKVSTKVLEVDNNSQPVMVHGNSKNGFVSIESLLGMPAYDCDAMLVGSIREIGLRRSTRGKMEINFKVSKGQETSDHEPVEVSWNSISKIGDIILLGETTDQIQSQDNTGAEKVLGRCTSCSYVNETDAVYCADCGKKIG
ncbi:MAG: hypothetical protein M3530_09150 [Thermoproteota archaeon]|nr:hypothetical protein [Thermoproteota archaeon]